MDDNKKEQAMPETNSYMYTFMGREYDLATPEGKAGFEAAKSTMESLVGKQANEVGQLRKQVSQFEAVKDLDRDQMLKQVAVLREEGDYAAADKMLFDYADSRELVVSQKASQEAWFEEYYQSRKDELNGLPKELVKTYLRANVSKLAGNDDSALAADNLIKPLVPAKTEVPEQEEVFSGASAASRPAKSSKEVESDRKEEKSSAWDDLYAEFDVN